jgi:hypothetical protein
MLCLMTKYPFVTLLFCNAVLFFHVLFCNLWLCNVPFCNIRLCNVPLCNVPFCKAVYSIRFKLKKYKIQIIVVVLKHTQFYEMQVLVL